MDLESSFSSNFKNTGIQESQKKKTEMAKDTSPDAPGPSFSCQIFSVPD